LTVEASDRLLDRVRKLLAKAEAAGTTPEEAEALTAKATELMAKYGIDRALLAAQRPETDQPGSRLVDIYNPWGRVRAHLLCGLASAMRCQPILVTSEEGTLRVHIFGYASDLERTDLLFTSVLIQMWHGLIAAEVPARAYSTRAWRRSWLLGFAAAVTARVRAAEERAERGGSGATDGQHASTALVLADRSLVIRRNMAAAYPHTRTARTTYTGSGYGDGYAQGQRADIGTGRVGKRRDRSLTASGL
jgi:Protein of unknown function (DUF2786)